LINNKYSSFVVHWCAWKDTAKQHLRRLREAGAYSIDAMCRTYRLVFFRARSNLLTPTNLSLNVNNLHVVYLLFCA